MLVLHYRNSSLTYDESKSYDLNDIKYIAMRDDKKQSYVLCRYIPDNDNSTYSQSGYIYDSKINESHKVVIIAVVSNMIKVEQIIESYRKALEAFPEHQKKGTK